MVGETVQVFKNPIYAQMTDQPRVTGPNGLVFIRSSKYFANKFLSLVIRRAWLTECSSPRIPPYHTVVTTATFFLRDPQAVGKTCRSHVWPPLYDVCLVRLTNVVGSTVAIGIER